MTRERDPDREPDATGDQIVGESVSAAAQWPALAGFIAAEARLQ
jgi:hypothetical protein